MDFLLFRDVESSKSLTSRLSFNKIYLHPHLLKVIFMNNYTFYLETENQQPACVFSFTAFINTPSWLPCQNPIMTVGTVLMLLLITPQVESTCGYKAHKNK